MIRIIIALGLAMLLMGPGLSAVAIDEIGLETTNQSYIFLGGASLSGTIYLNSSTMDIDHIYIFTIGSNAGCNESIIGLAADEIEWNESCPEGENITHNIGNITLNMTLLVNGTVNDTLEPTGYYIRFNSSGSGLYKLAMVEMNGTITIHIKNPMGDEIQTAEIRLVNSSGGSETRNVSSPFTINSSELLAGFSNLTATAMVMAVDEEGIATYANGTNTTLITNAAGGDTEYTLTLYNTNLTLNMIGLAIGSFLMIIIIKLFLFDKSPLLAYFSLIFVGAIMIVLGEGQMIIQYAGWFLSSVALISFIYEWSFPGGGFFKKKRQ